MSVQLFYLDVLPRMSSVLFYNQMRRLSWLCAPSIHQGQWWYIGATYAVLIAILVYLMVTSRLAGNPLQVRVIILFATWLAGDILIVSNLSFLVRHKFFPWLMKPDVANVSGWMEEKIASERSINVKDSNSRLNSCIEGEQISDATAGNDAVNFNAAQYFFMSHRLLSSEKFDYPESNAMLSFRTVWPRRSFSPESRSAYSYPAQWMNRFSEIGICSSGSYLGSALFNFLNILFACPVWMQDVLLDVLLWGLVLSVCFLHVQLYYWGTYLVIIPGCLALVALCFVVSFRVGDKGSGVGSTKASQVAAIPNDPHHWGQKVSPSTPSQGTRVERDNSNAAGRADTHLVQVGTDARGGGKHGERSRSTSPHGKLRIENPPSKNTTLHNGVMSPENRTSPDHLIRTVEQSFYSSSPNSGKFDVGSSGVHDIISYEKNENRQPPEEGPGRSIFLDLLYDEMLRPATDSTKKKEVKISL